MEQQKAIDFSTRLKRAMTNKAVTAVELSNRTGISKGAISSYLRGRYEPKQSTIFSISEALNISPSFLLGLDEEEQRNQLDQVFERIELNYNKLDRHNQILLADHSDLLVASSEYAKLNNSDN